ncbi:MULTISPECIES: septum site-determining protein Ssd [Streptomyces]|uniref:septum site-determining protein Ssd n=1 Tax=Streptomyces TaxID=1883 RepID=UPI00163D06D7|nr:MULTISPECIES: septum site-determining protein Ssd [Streptomyces]MBC2875817.1 septum formation initiator [Streptomyces sp. TYQ1024]UBI37668.1 septum formation initiator [Streptomyces mobaraensis]UKW30255.1 septum formation initiator [Streptomyces sp. TYQ1024]
MTGPETSDWARAAATTRGGPLIATEDEDLLDDLLRLCAAAGAMPEVCHGTSTHRGTWERASLVLVGGDCTGRLAGLPHRENVVLVGREPADPDLWRRAVLVGARNVALLPDEEGWLVDRIADTVEDVDGPALTVGVIGGRGGAGASTLACALAIGAARTGRRTMLVDADPLGGGLDVLLGAERIDGLRWPAFAGSRGRMAGRALEEVLPEPHGLRLLSWDRGDSEVPPEAVRAVLAAARRRGGVVVVDLPRGTDGAAVEVLRQLDLGLLVVPSELRAVAAAHRVASAIGLMMGDLRLVVRGPCGPGLDGEEIARLLDIPLAGEVPQEPGLAQALISGRPPGGAERGPLAAFCAEFWARALPEGPEVPA